MESKYIGKVYDGFKVVEYYKKNSYRKQYGKESKPTPHNAYNYKLYNDNTHQVLELSGNQLRLLESGKRTIWQMLNTSAKCSRNVRINAYLKWLRTK